MSRPLPLPPERPGVAAPPDLAERRAELAAAVAAGVWHVDPPPRQTERGGVRCLHFAAHRPARGTVLHFHGGAFRIGCPEQIAPFAAALAAACAVDVVCPAYRLAPEHPFPAGLRDGFAAMAALAGQCAAPLVLTGDSAGGGLAASLAAMAGETGIALAGLALLSPWLDLTVCADSYIRHAASDPLFSQAAASAAAALYLQGAAAGDPLASPLLGGVAGFPPTFINVGSGEVLADDAARMAEKLRAAGRDITFQPVAGMAHVAVTRGADLPGSTETFAALCGFLDRILPPAQLDAAAPGA